MSASRGMRGRRSAAMPRVSAVASRARARAPGERSPGVVAFRRGSASRAKLTPAMAPRGRVDRRRRSRRGGNARGVYLTRRIRDASEGFRPHRHARGVGARWKVSPEVARSASRSAPRARVRASSSEKYPSSPPRRRVVWAFSQSMRTMFAKQYRNFALVSILGKFWAGFLLLEIAASQTVLSPDRRRKSAWVPASTRRFERRAAVFGTWVSGIYFRSRGRRLVSFF